MTMHHHRRRRNAERTAAILGVVVIGVIGVVYYISYTANSGLPLQKSNDVFVELRNANRIIEDADVRIAGFRVGRVSSVTAVTPGDGGRPYARVGLRLKPSVGALPTDTTVKVRPASTLGMTYLQLELGEKRQTLAEGETLPLSQAQETVELPDLFQIYDDNTKRNYRNTVASLGGGFAGRGRAFNRSIHSFSTLMPPLTRVMATLEQPRTRLGDYVRTWHDAFDALEPVDDEFAGLISGLADTLGAFDRERPAMAEMIELSPPAESAATEMFTRSRPAFDKTAELTVDLRSGTRVLPAALREVNGMLADGMAPLRQLPSFSRDLRPALAAVEAVSRDPATLGAVRKSTDILIQYDRTLEHLAPAQIYCNIVALWGDNYGRSGTVFGAGRGPAFSHDRTLFTGAEGENLQNEKPSRNVGINFEPIEDETECESGNNPYEGEQALGNPPGRQPARTRDTDPPPGSRERAARAGLLRNPEGAPPPPTGPYLPPSPRGTR